MPLSRSATLAVVTLLASFAGVSPAMAAVKVSGTVTCKAGNVVGVWVQSTGGGSNFASWSALPGNGKVARYSRSVSPGSVELHVGCGGTKKNWGSDQWTKPASVQKNRVLNAFCSGPLDSFKKVKCAWPARSSLAGANAGLPGQCTAWAASKWKKASGKLPNWFGDAHLWNERARAAKWTVSGAPALRSIVVFEAGSTNGFNYGPVGHVAWVESIDYRSDGWYLRVSEQNLPSGSGPRSDRVVKHVSGMNYIHAPG